MWNCSELSFCVGGEVLKLLFLVWGLLSEHIPFPSISAQKSVSTLALLYFCGMAVLMLVWLGRSTLWESQHSHEFAEWIRGVDNGAANPVNGLQTVKQLWQVTYNARFLPPLYFSSVTQNDYLQGKSIRKGFQLYFRKTNNSKRNKVSIFNFSPPPCPNL